MTPEQQETLAQLRTAAEEVEAGKRAQRRRRELVAQARRLRIAQRDVEAAAQIGRKAINEIEREAGFAPRLPGGGFPESGSS
ncbi:hypothetical protein [Spongiactinospora sp. TRM90649]|uniref:hypothetical protein n=1 Tax=Spongiactinospora sp. TRM90649 TaxID=3031114 RepID=UPI0023F82280|nr:hypothetical protein [Spongiactinospora sp. TRM90649]MDF5756621.1 hypothetical protein [Spongiactinospora sp. TRM90649]